MLTMLDMSSLGDLISDLTDDDHIILCTLEEARVSNESWVGVKMAGTSVPAKPSGMRVYTLLVHIMQSLLVRSTDSACHCTDLF